MQVWRPLAAIAGRFNDREWLDYAAISLTSDMEEQDLSRQYEDDEAVAGAVEGNGAIITLGNVHFQEDGSALVSASIYIANLAAGGLTYIVERIDGVWQVVGDTGARWIS